MSTTLDELKGLIAERFDAIGEQVSEQRIEEIVRTSFGRLVDDKEFVRKMRWPSPDPELIGTKYARWGLTVGDVEFLYDMQCSLKGQRRVTLDGIYQGPSEELTRTFNAISEAEYLSETEIREIDKRAIDDIFPRIPKSRLARYLPSWMKGDRDTAAQRAMDTAESGFGSQLIGAQYVRELWEAARPESRIFALIPSFEMTDPTVYLPVEVDIPELLFVGENTANNSSEYTTVKTGSQRVQVDAKKFIIHQMWSGELEEDSIIPFIPFLRRQATLSIAHYSDSLVINGDTTNTATGNINLDDADPADTKHYLAFDGIRHASLVDNTGNAIDAAGGVTLAQLSAMRGTMLDSARLVDWGHPTSMEDLVYAADPQTADQIAMIDEVVKARQWMTPGAGLLNGEVGRIIGHPVISSMAVPKTEADGKVSTTAANNTKGQVVLFNRRGFIWGWRRRVRVETERLPSRDQTRIVYSLRAGFGRFTPTGAASGIEASSVLYNITL